MNILKELKKAWDNALTSAEEKTAKENVKTALDELKKDILSQDIEQAPSLPEKASLPKLENLERLDRVKTDEAALKEQAKIALKDYEKTARQNIADKVVADTAKIEKSKLAAETAKNDSLERIDEAYVQAKRNLDNDALKRGLARSSIAVAQSAEIESDRAENRTRAENEYAAQVSELNRLLEQVETGKISSLAELKESMQTRIAEKTAELKEKAEKADQEAVKYNNSLAEKEASAEIGRLKAEEAIYAQALSSYEKARALDKSLGGKTDRQTANMYASNYNKMDEFLSSVNRSDAAEILKGDPFFKANLTEYLYYKLYDKYVR